jgi:hypothetical protein
MRERDASMAKWWTIPPGVTIPSLILSPIMGMQIAGALP